jgi:membrane protease YdiL (CAAX protease family)
VAADRSLSGPGALTRAAAPGRPATPVAADAVLAAGLAFLLARPALVTTAAAVPLLAAGYVAMAAAALAVPAASAAAPASTAAAGQGAEETPPLGWGAPLGIGLAAVTAAGVVAGPAPHPRVGAAAAGLGLLAAVAEEALFRRLLYLRLTRLTQASLARYGTVVAVLGSAVLFALVHLPAYGTAALPVDLGAGLLLSWQRSASGRWAVPAVTHAVANLLAVT